MDMKRVIEMEENNLNKIYLYRNVEETYCKAYEFSAFLLTKLTSVLKLEEEPTQEVNDVLYTVKVDPQFIKAHFSSFGIAESDGCIEVSLYDVTHSRNWRCEFDLLKVQQREQYSKLGNLILGVSRLGK